MWPWRLMPVIELRKLRVFVTALCLIFASSLGYSAPTSLGPTSPEEAQILWQDGQLSLKESRFQDTVNQLGRYVARYPGEPGFLESHLLLGKAYFELKRPAEALPVLLYYVNSKGVTPASAEARTWLGRTYLELGKFHEALQVSLELDGIPNQSAELKLWHRLIKAQALVNLNHDTRASTAIEVLESEITDTTPKDAKGKIYSLKLQVKTRLCARLGTSAPVEETQALSLADRRGICLQEALLIFNKILQTENSSAASIGASQLILAYETYRSACKNAPPPKPVTDHVRTRREASRYQAELAELLLKNYKANTLRSLELLNSWAPAASSPTSPAFLLVSSRLKKTLLRIP